MEHNNNKSDNVELNKNKINQNNNRTNRPQEIVKKKKRKKKGN